MSELRLEVAEFEGPTRWRWVLSGPGGSVLAEHEVRLDTSSWQFEAFADLQGYLRWHVAPDEGIADETRIIAEVGDWIGQFVFGSVGPAMVSVQPAAVRVLVPAQAAQLMFWPLELARVDGRPLATQGVTLAFDADGRSTSWTAEPVRERLRVLGLFSSPSGGSALNIRRERQALVQLLAGENAQGLAVDVRTLQYGVTREALRTALEESEGWDVIHLSGHGAPGELVLEREDGSPDRVTAAELADLLSLARERVKLVWVSASQSATPTSAYQRHLLGLPSLANEREAPEVERGRGVRWSAGALASELVDRLGCAVVAMRFAVTDEFAIELADHFYRYLVERGMSLPRALGTALQRTVMTPPTPQFPPLSVGTPTLFGARAVDLRLSAPRRSGAESYDTAELKLAGFPSQPDRFVGRTKVMFRANAALAPRSGQSGVMLYGIPGGGKTACALELAYTHEHAFDRLVWFMAPDDDQDIASSLTNFALTLERWLPGFRMVHLLDDPARLHAFLPALTELLERRRLLIVVDNLQSLLTSSRQWRDARWGKVIAAMCGHAGIGRVVLTSRRVPEGLDARVRTVSVDALSLDETLLLARELPHLRDLMDGHLPGMEPATTRQLAVRVLETTQGHPKLIELADGQAANPDRLQAIVDAASEAWRGVGGLPDRFLAIGEPDASGNDYLSVIGAWTTAVAARFTGEELDLLAFLCFTEEADRLRAVLDANWADLWHRLRRDGEPPELDTGLAAVSAANLVSIQPSTNDTEESYSIHPAVAAAVRSQIDADFRQAVDIELAAFWAGVARHAQDDQTGQLATGVVVRAALSAGPYLLRLGEWRQGAALLEQALLRDDSRATAAAVLPVLRALAAAASGAEDEHSVTRVLSRALGMIDPAAAEDQARKSLDAALSQGDYKAAAAYAGDLISYWRAQGRLAEALALADSRIDYTRRAGLGPWTQLQAEGQRLQVLAAMGQAGSVLAEVDQLRNRMAAIPDISEQPENVRPWVIRELLLDTGAQAARGLGRWQEALDLNAAALASMDARGASDSESAKTRFNGYTPLLRLGRTDDALRLLSSCRTVFESDHDIEMLGITLSALADVEHMQGHGDTAISYQLAALRYTYMAGDVHDIAINHHNLGSYLALHANQPIMAIAHHLASALILSLTGSADIDASIHAAADDFGKAGGRLDVPDTVSELVRQVEATPGAELGRLLSGVAPGPDVVQQVLEELVIRVRALATTQPPDRAEAPIGAESITISPGPTERTTDARDIVRHATAAESAGEPRVALAYWRQAVEKFRDGSDQAGLASALARMGAVLVVLRNFEEAVACCEEAAAISRDLSDPSGELSALTGLMEAYRDLGLSADLAAAEQRAADIQHALSG